MIWTVPRPVVLCLRKIETASFVVYLTMLSILVATACRGGCLVSSEWEDMWNETVVTGFEVLSQNFPRGVTRFISCSINWNRKRWHTERFYLPRTPLNLLGPVHTRFHASLLLLNRVRERRCMNYCRPTHSHCSWQTGNSFTTPGKKERKKTKKKKKKKKGILVSWTFLPLTLHRDLALFHIHIEVPNVIYLYLFGNMRADTEFRRMSYFGLRHTKIRHEIWVFSFNYSPIGPGPPHCRGFTITLRHTTLGRTPMNEWSTRRRDLYLTTHNTHKRQKFTPPAELEPAIPAIERLQINALDREATGIGWNRVTFQT